MKENLSGNHKDYSKIIIVLNTLDIIMILLKSALCLICLLTPLDHCLVPGIQSLLDDSSPQLGTWGLWVRLESIPYLQYHQQSSSVQKNLLIFQTTSIRFQSWPGPKHRKQALYIIYGWVSISNSYASKWGLPPRMRTMMLTDFTGHSKNK